VPKSHFRAWWLAIVVGAAALAGCGGSGQKSATSATAGADTVKQDAAAKADVRNAVTLMEVCYTDNQDYAVCTPAKLQAANGAPGLSFGSGPGQVEIAPSAQSYTVTAHSRTGNTFAIKKDPQGVTTRSCVATVQGGCRNGQW